MKIKNINIDAKECSGWKRAIGLMFKRREKANALIFEFDKPTKMSICSLFVFFPFIAIWLDKKNEVIGSEVVKPFTISVSPKKPFSKLIEIPLNKKYNQLNKILVGDRKV